MEDGVIVTDIEMDEDEGVTAEDAFSAAETLATTVAVGIIVDIDEAVSVDIVVVVSAAPRLLPAPEAASAAAAGPSCPRASIPMAVDRKGMKPCGIVSGVSGCCNAAVVWLY